MKYEVNKKYTTDLANREQLQEPSPYQIVVHNDDFTPMEFVIGMLERFFYMTRRKAAEVTLEAHVKGSAVAGVYSKDVAESKLEQVVAYVKKHDHPLVCSMEATS